METVKNPEASGCRMYMWKFGSESILVQGEDIMYLHTEQRKVYVHTPEGVYRIRGSLKAAAEDVADLPMIKTHASYLVNLKYLQRVNRHEAILRNGEHIPVSVRCRPQIRPVIETYIKGGAWKNPLT